jgi:hypothetical protein
VVQAERRAAEHVGRHRHPEQVAAEQVEQVHPQPVLPAGEHRQGAGRGGELEHQLERRPVRAAAERVGVVESQVYRRVVVQVAEHQQPVAPRQGVQVAAAAAGLTVLVVPGERPAERAEGLGRDLPQGKWTVS